MLLLMLATPRFSEEQVDAAIDYLIEQAAEDRAASRSYSLVFRAAGLEAPQDLYRDGAEQIVANLWKPSIGAARNASCLP